MGEAAGSCGFWQGEHCSETWNLQGFWGGERWVLRGHSGAELRSRVQSHRWGSAHRGSLRRRGSSCSRPSSELLEEARLPWAEPWTKPRGDKPRYAVSHRHEEPENHCESSCLTGYDLHIFPPALTRDPMPTARGDKRKWWHWEQQGEKSSQRIAGTVLPHTDLNKGLGMQVPDLTKGRNMMMALFSNQH